MLLPARKAMLRESGWQLKSTQHTVRTEGMFGWQTLLGFEVEDAVKQWFCTVCTVVSCLLCIVVVVLCVVSCLLCIVVVDLCVLL
jgi:hypothetical protein